MGEYHLRRVEYKDKQLLYEWVTDKTVRENSFHTGEISVSEHEGWFEKHFYSEQCDMFILEYKGEPIGQIRIDWEGNDGEISYSIASGYRGQGHGTILLQMVETELKERGKQLVAKVKKGNVASGLFFERVGYHKTMEKDYIIYSKYMDNNICKKFKLQKKSVEYGGGVMFLTNNWNTLSVLSFLEENEEKVIVFSDRLDMRDIAKISPCFIVSYNYSYLIPHEIIDYMKGNVINLHISLLPWNRGSSPNIWSFIDNTPKGVTIHKVDASLDTGEILLQKKVNFDVEQETFASSYEKLNEEIQKLFMENWNRIKKGDIMSYSQKGDGTYHCKKDLEQLLQYVEFSWDDKIQDFLKKIDK